MGCLTYIEQLVIQAYQLWLCAEDVVALAEEIPVARRETMVEAIAHALIQYIAKNNLRAGDQLPSERNLVSMTGASRLPLREALALMRGLGIIESRQGKGAFVKQLDLASLFGMLSPLLKTQSDIDVRHLFEARLSLESSIAELAAEHRSDEQLQTLDRILAHMRSSVKDRAAFMQHDTEFHRELARAAANPVFVVFMASIMDLLAEMQTLYRDRVAFRNLAVREHETLLNAIREHDAAGARQAVEKHLHNAMERL